MLKLAVCVLIILATVLLGSYAFYKIPVVSPLAHVALTILGGVLGYFVGIFAIPICNSIYHKKLKKLLTKGDVSRFDTIFIILIFTACGTIIGGALKTTEFVTPMFIGAITGAFLGGVFLIILIKIGEYAKNRNKEDG
jgi:ABC-type transport system involved in multi-copper enzyme maturation permease subunit